MPRDKRSYARQYRSVDFSKHPEQYRIGKGEQGVLLAEPYKSELLPLWRFKTPDIARRSARAIYSQYQEYKAKHDFVGMDMARKYLQMGYTRARRYANHKSGRKYDTAGRVLPRDYDPLKAESAKIFLGYYRKVVNDTVYQRLKRQHLKNHGGK